MLLSFGPVQIDTRDLPAVYRIGVDSVGADPLVRVDILLADDQRSAIARWAEHLGVPVVEHEVRPSYANDLLTRQLEAVLQAGGWRVRVWTRVAAKAPGPGGGAP